MSAAATFSSSSYSMLRTSAKPSSTTNSSSCCSRSIKMKAVAQEAVRDGLVFNQNFLIRSFDIGPDRKATLETLMNLSQETTFNHHSGGQVNEGFSTTPEMSRNNLTWVIIKMQLLMDRYPSWGDSVQVDTWNAACGENKLRCDWHILNPETKETYMRATSVLMAMNKDTRRLSKIPEEVRAGLHVFDRVPLLNKDNRKLRKLSGDNGHSLKRSLSPVWSDLDVNQHVNNVKYISWILESVPMWIHESYEITGMSLEYRRECGRNSMLESVISLSNDSSYNWPETTMEFEHMLQLECGVEILRGRTQWRPKSVKL